MKVPRWYHRNEIKEWFSCRGISHSPKEIVMFTEALQKAFEKGWEKCLDFQQGNKGIKEEGG